MNWTDYLEEHGVTRGEIIEAVKAIYPKYTKGIHSMVESGKYGVTLKRDAAKLVVETFGGKDPDKELLVELINEMMEEEQWTK